MTDGPTNVVQALALVIRDLPAIGKDLQASAQQGGYSYRGIEAVTREAAPLLAKHGVVFAPHRVEWLEPRELVINSKPWTDERALVTYRVYGPGGPEDFIEVGVMGIGRDNSDKGTNKVLTQAFKYALLQTLCIADGKDDADGTTHEADGQPAPPAVDPAKAELDQFLAEVGALPDHMKEPMREWWRGAQAAHLSAADALATGRATLAGLQAEEVGDSGDTAVDARPTSEDVGAGVTTGVASPAGAPAPLPDATDEIALASTPCSRCGSTRAERALVGDHVRCTKAKDCDERAEKRRLAQENPCSVQGCPEPAVADDLCVQHGKF